MKKLSAAFIFYGLAQCNCFAADKATECELTVFSVYDKQNLALLMSPAAQPIKSVSISIAQRRLQESFCVQFATCKQGGNVDSLPFRTEFSQCLRDEARESN